MNFLRKVLLTIITISVVTSLSLTLTGCPPAPPVAEETTPEETTPEETTEAPSIEEVTLTFWHTYSDEESPHLTNVVIPKFENMYPNIKVESVDMPYEGLHDQLVTAVAGEEAPDLMRMDIIWVPEFDKLGALASLDQMEGFSDIKEKVYPGPLATNFYKGQYYGLPLNTNTQIAIYNKDMLTEAGVSEPPKTLEELENLVEKFDPSNNKWLLGIGGAWPWQILPWFWTAGGMITDEDITKASGYLNSEDSVAALQWILDMYKAGAIGPCVLGGEPDTWGGFTGDNYAVLADGPWFFAIMGEAVEDKAIGGLMPEGKGGSISVVGGENIVLFEGSKNKEAAWKFIQFMLSEETQLDMAEVGVIPTLKALADSDMIKSVWYYPPYFEQLLTAKPRTPHTAWNKMDEILHLAFESVLREQATPKEALDKAATEIDPLLVE